MDAKKTRETVAVNIAGREVQVLRPSEGQVVGLQMLQSDKVPAGVKLQGLSELMLSLLPTDDDKAWFVMQFTGGTYDVNDFILSVKAIITAPAAKAGAAPKAPAKRTAKKTTARRA
jgi:hypothetical protein